MFPCSTWTIRPACRKPIWLIPDQLIWLYPPKIPKRKACAEDIISKIAPTVMRADINNDTPLVFQYAPYFLHPCDRPPRVILVGDSDLGGCALHSVWRCGSNTIHGTVR